MAQCCERVDIVSSEQMSQLYGIPAPYLPCNYKRHLRPAGR